MYSRVRELLATHFPGGRPCFASQLKLTRSHSLPAADVPLRGDFNGTGFHPLRGFRPSVPTAGSSTGGSAIQFPVDSAVFELAQFIILMLTADEDEGQSQQNQD